MHNNNYIVTYMYKANVQDILYTYKIVTLLQSKHSRYTLCKWNSYTVRKQTFKMYKIIIFNINTWV